MVTPFCIFGHNLFRVFQANIFRSYAIYSVHLVARAPYAVLSFPWQNLTIADYGGIVSRGWILFLDCTFPGLKWN
jgi:hypothetical protein